MYIYSIYLFIGYFAETFLCVIVADKSSASASASGKKRKARDDSASGRKCQTISMETNVAIIKKLYISSLLLLLLFFFH